MEAGNHLVHSLLLLYHPVANGCVIQKDDVRWVHAEIENKNQNPPDTLVCRCLAISVEF